ncbi:hypothetical protein GCM10010297_41490 [Streptomyces malachitofuscus]|nr:hypothetical protein GCM10010297_41490 [Streptomyces malachitofuscus]
MYEVKTGHESLVHSLPTAHRVGLYELLRAPMHTGRVVCVDQPDPVPRAYDVIGGAGRYLTDGGDLSNRPGHPVLRRPPPHRERWSPQPQPPPPGPPRRAGS